MSTVMMTELRMMLEEAGIPRELSKKQANEFIDKGKTEYIINKYGYKLVCMKDKIDDTFIYKVERNEEN